ncbi:unnamed protein product [Mytilus edulis]|uniref:Mab-21-like nucleotidyltransferase domain-containing protein n=1 Tax=Mytilus edulis TaxID=6550 RepID=A0A8S3PR93_MYTED|nr:unnamed protein product [Mytilus edulis]
MDNTMLNKFDEDNVKMTRDETKQNVECVIPIVNNILQYLHERDRQFKTQPLNDGSYYSRIKVSREDGEAVNRSGIRQYVDVEKLSESPAATLTIKHPKITTAAISIDLSPLIEAHLQFKPEFGWPRILAKWPSLIKTNEIERERIHQVAKDPFYWSMSFVTCEKKLLDGIDSDGTCRKKSHRIMKKLREMWCPKGTKQELTSYHLKNILFWECENHPYDSEWTNDKLSVRVESMCYLIVQPIKRDETKEILDFVKPIIDYIVQYVHERDKRFKLRQLNVGSYYSRLKVSRADEFDYSVVLDLGPHLAWTTGTPAYYKFDGNTEVVRTSSPLPSAPVGKCVNSFSGIIPEWNKKRLNEGSACLTIGDHIIPLKVKKRFKALVSEAVKRPFIRRYVDAKRLSESPAVTLTIAKPNDADDVEPISVDLAPLIEAHLPFRSEFNWPRPGVGWPSSTQIKDIKDEGIHLVAKDPEYWSLSLSHVKKNC